MKRSGFVVILLLFATNLHAATEGEWVRIDEPGLPADHVVAEARIVGTFYTGTLNWYYQGGIDSLSMRGHARTDTGGVLDRVTACFFNESAFSRRFTATASVVQSGRTLQAIKFARDFAAERFSCHTLTGFKASLAPGEFQIVVSYDPLEDDNLFAGLSATDSGLTFDVQIGSQRPPYAAGDQGPILMRGVGIKYELVESDAPQPPPAVGNCTPSAESACLLDGRFRVMVRWQTNSGSGTAQVMSFGGNRAENDQSAFFWFFNPNNFEIGVKMVNACTPPFNSYWAFVSGLTNQGYEVTIDDTVTNHRWTHRNPIGALAQTESDTGAFACD